MKIVTYIRVSTDKQGRSGLGIEGQRAAIAAYAATHGAEIVAEFEEVESGRIDSRPQLESALRTARAKGATLVIAKLDRLSRNAAFLLNLQDSKVPFVACDIPTANPMTIGIMSVLAQEESRMIGDRTRVAMKAAKARGKTFGNPNGADALRRADKGNTAAVQVIKTRALARASDLSAALEDLRNEGFNTLQAKANELNKRGFETARGKQWHPTSVARLEARLAA
ncbi:Site-specific DNA recombinase [Octadecabacter temperatus]|uniref:DNA-invertase hin n=1 Tax=Octadecabacter temperatus TaxID=1458307 RepID=A0A0K0Y4C1_9RHOB|nr:recombinase family protein [Octadecabacter temperatus]AKS45799.1 DNA-invertase hin [Octadecabacter temperatus]SIO00792.1 Site-specific DNA recombinase [Octadecabacter temperatus]